jgi:hypothetical protein
MAKVYETPIHIQVPEFNWENIEQYNKDCDKFKQDLKEFLLKRKKGKLVGEIVRFQVADGYAEYMVAGLKPVELVHIPTWDAWTYQYAYLLTAKEIEERINSERMLAELFGGKK